MSILTGSRGEGEVGRAAESSDSTKFPHPKFIKIPIRKMCSVQLAADCQKHHALHFFKSLLYPVHVPLIPRSGIHYTELSLLCDGTQVQDSEALALKNAISLKHAHPHSKTICMFHCRCSCLHTWNLFASSLHSFSCFAFSGRTTWMLLTMAAYGLLNDET